MVDAQFTQENMTVLKGTGRDGDVVHQNQKMATEDGFKNVSKIWYNKTQSYDEGFSHLEDRVEQREDIRCKPHAMEAVVHGGQLCLAHEDGRFFSLTDHALRQLATRCYVSHAFVKQMNAPAVLNPSGTVKFKRDIDDREMLAAVINNGMRRMNANNDYLFRSYKDDSSIRAVLTSDYATIDNRWYLEQVQRIIPGGRLSHFQYSDADTIYGNVLIPDSIREEDDSDYGGMISIGNCEIGIRAMEQYPSVFRAICMNGCIWDQTTGGKLRQVHRGKIDYDSLTKMIETNITAQIPLIDGGIQKMLEMQQMKLGDASMKQILAEVSSAGKLDGRETREVFSQFNLHEKEHRNGFGVVNALTRAGQVFPANEWFRIDTVAGKLVAGGEEYWGRVVKRAATLTDDDIEKILGRNKNAELVA